MGLVLSSIGVDTGLAWETNLNASLTAIDQHNHTNGQGIQIPPAGININSALSFNNQQATNMQAILFTEQTSLATDLALYVKTDGNAYYNDGAGNVIQLTSGGAVNATSSGISSGTASASFSAGVLIVNEASNTPANVQMGSVLLGNNSSGSKFLTLAPPAAMAANYTVTLPTIPGAQSFMAIDTSGNITGYAAVAGGITGTMIAPATVARSNQVAVGQQISSKFSGSGSSGAVSTLQVTLTTTGRPICIGLNGIYSITFGPTIYHSAYVTASTTADITLYDVGNNVPISIQNVIPSQPQPASSFNVLYAAAAGTYTFQVYINQATGDTGTVTFENVVLYAYEL